MLLNLGLRYTKEELQSTKGSQQAIDWWAGGVRAERLTTGIDVILC